MNHAARMRTLVVHADSGFRQGLVRALGLNPWVEVVGAAISGRTALPKVVSYRPDVVVVDLDRNEGDGIELLEYLERSHPGVLRLAITSPSVDEQCAATVSRMAGVDVVRRPAGDADDATVSRLVQELVPPMLRRATRAVPAGGEVPVRAGEAEPRVSATVAPPAPPTPPPAPIAAPAAPSRPAAVVPPPAVTPPSVAPAAPPVAKPIPATPRIPTVDTAPPRVVPTAPVGGRSPRVVGIGVSTGGPKALSLFLPMLPADFPLPIVLVQHMPPKFTKSLADSLDKTCALRVREAQTNDKVERGTILIAPGGFHMAVAGRDGGATIRLTEDPPECSCRPSVDYLFRSLVEVYGGRTLGVVLTGMGEDGWIGSRLITGAGGAVLAQDEATSTVYGMPRGPIEEGLARAVPLERMAEQLMSAVRGIACN